MADETSTALTWYETTRVTSPVRERLSHDLDVDVCVIGGGLAGLTAAREVARRGERPPRPIQPPTRASRTCHQLVAKAKAAMAAAVRK